MIRRLIVLSTAIGLAVCMAWAAGRDWATTGGDAQRSSWIPADPKISPDSMRQPGFQFLWKLQLSSEPRHLDSLTPAILLNDYIGYRGFRSLGFVGGSSGDVVALDTDLGRIEWRKRLATDAPLPDSSVDCPGGMTSNLARPTSAQLPAAGASGGGRGTPARSAVGKPGEGAVTLIRAPRPSAAKPRPSARPAPPPRPSRVPYISNLLFALSGDGMLHTMYVSNGGEREPPTRLLPPNARAGGLMVVEEVAYASTTHGCGGVPDGVWGLDLYTKQASSWKAEGGAIAGPPAIGPDGTVYVAAAGAVSALEPVTLKLKDSYTSSGEFTSSPVLFEYKERLLIAVTTKDGRLHLLDSAALGGADHKTPLYKTPAYSSAADFAPGALASWQAADGTRWVLAAAAGPIPNGNVTNGAVMAWKVTGTADAPVLEPGWVSRDMVAPLTPMIVNGVVFALSSGEFRTADTQVSAAQRAQRSSPAIMYALDGATGKELWNSGTAITSFVHSGGLSGGGSQVYVETYDGTLFVFGFPMEH